ncbi:MAG: ATP phosphoribosyltransferase regulatory subunit [Alphaproteobacteria bacterium]
MSQQKALLPTGFQDRLPPYACIKRRWQDTILSYFSSCGYDYVEPPFLEFEKTLLKEAGDDMARQTFRLMDPVSQEMMGVRTDMTTQVARIAASRLADAPRPLRLSYAGNVLRVKGTDILPERQFTQIGVELIGSDALNAEVEIILIAVEALKKLGIQNISIDLNLPSFILEVVDALGLDQNDTELLAALEKKDKLRVESLAGNNAALLVALLNATGEKDAVIEKIKALNLAPALQGRITYFCAVAKALNDAGLENITIDLVERRGFSYYKGISFSLFAEGFTGELGRGGRYETVYGETATGFSLFSETFSTLLEAATATEKKIFIPLGADLSEVEALRKKGYKTVWGLEDHADLLSEAKRLLCGYVYQNKTIIECK